MPSSQPRSAAGAIAVTAILAASLVLAAARATPAADAAPAAVPDGFVPLFNGKDLSGWVPVNVHPRTFTVRDGLIVSTGVPTGVMRTQKRYENFILELEYKHLVAGGNAGLFVWSEAVTALGQPFTRSIEVQILDGRNSDTYTSHGDVFAIHGATMKPDRPHPQGWERCLPSERRAKPAGEWNHYRVTCNDGVLKLEVNGKEVSGGSACLPKKGYICLEAEGSECHFRNIRIRELPSTGATEAQSAPEAVGYEAVFRGIDLAAFEPADGLAEAWKVNDWRLVTDGKAAGAAAALRTKARYGDVAMIVDFKPAKAGAAIAINGARLEGEAGKWNRAAFTRRGGNLELTVGGKSVPVAVEEAVEGEGPIVLEHAGQPVEVANWYVRPLK